MRSELDKFLAPIVLEKGEPGPEHKRLKKELDSWAIADDFAFEYGRFPNGVRPDVLRGCKERGYLFVGDVKDSKQETPDVRESVARTEGYIREFAKLLGVGNYIGGKIAIATNSKKSAGEWVTCLNFLAKTAGIIDAQKRSPNFKIEKMRSANTWIVYW